MLLSDRPRTLVLGAASGCRCESRVQGHPHCRSYSHVGAPQAQQAAAEAAAARRANEEFRSRAMAFHVTMPQRSTKPLTEPQEVTMRTAKRRRVQGEGEVRVSSRGDLSTIYMFC